MQPTFLGVDLFWWLVTSPMWIVPAILVLMVSALVAMLFVALAMFLFWSVCAWLQEIGVIPHHWP